MPHLTSRTFQSQSSNEFTYLSNISNTNFIYYNINNNVINDLQAAYRP